jgi:hypothetical protein
MGGVQFKEENMDEKRKITRVMLPDGLQVTVESFLIEPSRDEYLAAHGVEETEDQRIAAPLLKAKRMYADWPEPHLIIPETLPEPNLPDHVVTAWCRFGDEPLVLVFFATVHESISLTELFQVHLEDIHADVLVNIDQEAERRKWFDWMSGEPPF